ncbi:hypothetical protein B0A49_09661 [Cryomyces minteri]|uniref:mitogen-activated protein kinase kinase n=1 Tax=Cryomyces minteri TaxID=331657 RepID=A0A4U0WM63_9PEZI|nr:hypothetical protein B0A49_09661 [Cryomyces minteri]
MLPHVDGIRPTRIQSTPPTSPTSSTKEMERPDTRGGAERLLTPPITPTQLRDVRSTGNLHHASQMSPSTGGDLSFGEIAGKDSKHAGTLSTPLSPSSLSATSPPATPLRTSLAEAARGDPTTRAVPSPPSGPESAYTEFDTSILDYDLDTTNPLGTGLWSTVYRAQPTSSSRSSSTTTPNSRLPTPPASPTSITITQPRPRCYAIKAVSRRDALSVLHHEARLLTHLSSLPRAHAHVVAFFGFDARRDALVLGASSSTLEAFVARINTLEACKRREVLSRVWPTLVPDLVRGLEWLHEVGGVVHADVKPGNILLDLEHASSSSSSLFSLESDDPVDALLNNNNNNRNNRPLRLRPRYCDFSASFHHPPPPTTTTASSSSSSSSTTPAVPAGAGTYAFMAPELLRPHALPTPASDVYALATTLLHALLGRPPYPAANAFALREMVKQGEPLRWARESEDAHRLDLDVGVEGARGPAVAAGAARGRRLKRTTPASDVRALATTLLHALLLGRPPYPAANAFALREMVKQGELLRWARESEDAHRLDLDVGVEGARGPAVAWLHAALKKRPEERMSASGWRGWLEEQRIGRARWGEGEDDA